MKKTLLISAVLIFSVNLQAQNCRLSPEAEHFWLRANAAADNLKTEEDHLIAIKQYQEVLKYNPDCTDAYYNIAWLYNSVIGMARVDYYEEDMEFELQEGAKYIPETQIYLIYNEEKKKWDSVIFYEEEFSLSIFNEAKKRWDLIALREKFIREKDDRMYVGKCLWAQCEKELKELNLGQWVATIYLCNDKENRWEILYNNSVLQKNKVVVDVERSNLFYNDKRYECNQTDIFPVLYTYSDIKRKVEICKGLPTFDRWSRYDRKLDYYIENALKYLKTYIEMNPEDVKAAKNLLAKWEIKQERKKKGLLWNK
jgi:hypothetical protein